MLWLKQNLKKNVKHLRKIEEHISWDVEIKLPKQRIFVWKLRRIINLVPKHYHSFIFKTFLWGKHLNKLFIHRLPKIYFSSSRRILLFFIQTLYVSDLPFYYHISLAILGVELPCLNSNTCNHVRTYWMKKFLVLHNRCRC